MAIRSEGHWFDLVDTFTAAALDTGSWDRALRGLAEATGSARGQLIGVGGAGGIPFNWVTDFDEANTARFLAIDGGNPTINPRVAAGVRAGVLQTISERDYAAVRPRLRSGIYDDHAAIWDIPFGCQTNLVHDPDLLIGLAVLRSARDGPTSRKERETFAALAPHVRTAVRTQMLLEGQSAALVAGSLEAVSLAAFVLNGQGDVQAQTPAAEALLRETALLSLRGGRLGSADRIGAAALDHAVARAAAGGAAGEAPVAATVILRDGEAGLPPLVLDILPLPRRRWSLAFDARLLVVPRGGRRGGDAAAVLVAGYRLTAAEASIALALAEGHSRERIAEDRGVSIGTVRTQLKSVFQKVGVTREIDLAARLHALL